MATYYDGLNYIYKLFEAEPPASSVQLLTLHLLHENNRHGNTGTIQISDRELGHRTSLSKQTITEAKRTLKNRGLIDFKTDRDKPHRGTTYTLIFFNQLGQTPGQRVGQTVGQTCSVFYTRAREELKTKDKENESIKSAGANVEELDELMEYWERDLQGGRLAFEHLSELSLWLNQRGMDWVKEMMKEASDSNNNPHGLSFKFLKAIVSKKLKSKKTSESSKGGGKKKEVKDTLAKLDELDY